MQNSRFAHYLPYLVVGLLALFPLVESPFYMQLLTKVLIMAIFAMSLDLLVGYTGLVSFGHAAYFGLPDMPWRSWRRSTRWSACGGRCRQPSASAPCLR